MHEHEISSLPVLMGDELPRSPKDYRQFHIHTPGLAWAVVTRRVNIDTGRNVAARISGQDRGMQALSGSLVEVLGEPIETEYGFHHGCQCLTILFKDVMVANKPPNEEQSAERVAYVSSFYQLPQVERQLLSAFNSPSFRKLSIREQLRRVLTIPVVKALGPERIVQLLADLRIWQMLDDSELPRGFYPGDEASPIHRYRFVD